MINLKMSCSSICKINRKKQQEGGGFINNKSKLVGLLEEENFKLTWVFPTWLFKPSITPGETKPKMCHQRAKFHKLRKHTSTIIQAKDLH